MAYEPGRPESEPDLDPEGPSEADLDRFGDEFLTCSACGADYYDQLDACPHCSTEAGAAKPPMAGWLMAVIGLVVVGFLLVAIF